MQYFSFYLLTLSLLASGGIAVAEGSADPEPKNQYTPEFLQSYTQECVQTSMGEGLESTEAQKLCKCTLQKFQQQYSQAEFSQLTTASAKDEKSKTALIEVGQVCFEQILYEE